MLHKQIPLAVVAAAALVTGAASTCNPLESTSCSDDTGLSTTYSYEFSDGEDGDNWSSVGSGDPRYTSSGAEFIIKKKGDAPTIQSEWYIFFGRVEVHMKAASGTGIVSSSVLLSDDLDEVDWEWLGGDENEVQTNYFSKGDSSTSGREADEGVSNSQSTSHNYTVDWTKESLTWYIDGTAVRTLSYSDTYPQTPMRVKLGIWAGGDSDNAEGTITWAGGETDYGDGPFTMTVESIKVTNYNPAKSYSYSDQTGDYSSIDISGSGDDSSSSSSSSSSSTSTSTLKTETKTSSGTSDATSSATGTTSATTFISASASASASATDSTSDSTSASASASASDADPTPAADSTSSSSNSTSTSSSPATVTSTKSSLGENISPSSWTILGAVGFLMLRHF